MFKIEFYKYILVTFLALIVFNIGLAETITPDGKAMPWIPLLLLDGGGEEPATLGSVKAYYSMHGKDWLDYIKNDGSDIFTATDTAATGAETGGYTALIHGGEIRVFEVTGKSSCEGLTAEDKAGAFQWICDNSTDPVRMISIGLKEEMNLSNLIDFSKGNWKEQSVTVYQDGVAFYSTPESVWWDNDVIVDNDGGSLDSPGSVYIAEADPHNPFVINADHVALVIKPGLRMTGSSTTEEKLISADNHDFLWIEGTINAFSDTAGVYLENSVFSVIRNVTVYEPNEGLYGDGIWTRYISNCLILNSTAYDTESAGLYLGSSTNNIVKNFQALRGAWLGEIILSSADYNQLVNITAVGSGQIGIYLYRSDNNYLKNIYSANNGSKGLLFYRGSEKNILENVILTNNGGSGVEIYGGKDNTILNLTVVNSNGRGVLLDDHTISGEGTYYATNNVIINFTAANFAAPGVDIRDNSNNNTFMNILAANYHNFGLRILGSNYTSVVNFGASHGTYGFYLDNASYNYFTGLRKVGNQSTNICSVTGGADPGLVDSTCANQGTSDGTLITDITCANSFVGKLYDDDPENESEITNGDGTADYTDITDWTVFSSLFRSWGKDGNPFPDATNIGRLTSGTGRLWDFSLSSSDSVVREVLSLPTGNDYINHKWSDGSTIIFLRNAVEIIGDDIGNDNGLCESGENCLYTPNIGSYQGHGSLVDAGDFVDGTLTGILLKKFTINGR